MTPRACWQTTRGRSSALCSAALASRTRSIYALAALGALVAVGLGGYRLWTLANEPARTNDPSPDDNLLMLASFADAATAGPRDRLAAGAGRLVHAHGGDGAVDVQPGAGGAPTLLAHIGAPIAGLAVGPGAAWVTSGRAVRRIPLDGGAPVVVTDKLVRPHAIAVGDGTIVVVDADPDAQGMLRASRVVRLSAAPGAPDGGNAAAAVLGHYQGEVENVAVDHGDAFWTDPLEGSVLGAAAGALAPSMLATERGLPGAVVVVGDLVVWVEKRSESLWAVPRAGGAPRQLLQDFAGFAHLVAHGDKVAWVNEAAVDGKFRVLEAAVTADGGAGEVTALSPAVDSVEDLACDGKRLYWLRDGVVEPVEAAETLDGF